MTGVDAVVIGAGLAGVVAASELDRRGLSVLLLEREPGAGGRVATRQRDGLTYELGAVFCPAGDALPPALRIDADAAREPSLVGLVHDGILLTSDTPTGLLGQVPASARQRLNVARLLECPSPQAEAVGADLDAAIRALFHVIHPGAFADTSPARRRDAFVHHDTNRLASGNGSLVASFLDGGKVVLRTGREVLSLTPHRQGVTVESAGADGPDRTDAAHVVLATTASVAASLLRGPAFPTPGQPDSLPARVRFAGGQVAVVALRDVVAPGLPGCIAFTNALFGSFVVHRYGKGTLVLTAFAVGEHALVARELDDASLLSRVLEQFDALDVGAIERERVQLLDRRFWEEVGPVIDDSVYCGFSERWLRPAPRIVLAGDYTWWDATGLPYGMPAAIASGRRAAALVANGVTEAAGSRFVPEPLATTRISCDNDTGPVLEDIVRDGTVAYYGLLLQVAPDSQLECYLVDEACDGLWEYQQGYGVTSLDSALVMEGLLASGGYADRLEASAARLVEQCFATPEGAFLTIPAGRMLRARYWSGVDVSATASSAWLLRQIAPDRFAAEISASVRWIERNQLVTGNWRGKWFPSATLPVYHAVRVLDDPGPAHAGRRARARSWLLSGQRQDGSWMGSVIESAAAVLALTVLADTDSADQSAASLGAATAWLCSRRDVAGAWSGEPILDYWFDHGRRRRRFHSVDDGRVTSAWATLALRAAARVGAA